MLLCGTTRTEEVKQGWTANCAKATPAAARQINNRTTANVTTDFTLLDS